MKLVALACLALAAGARGAAAQAPVVQKAGADAVILELVGRSGAGAAPDTTTILAARDEVRRFVQTAQELRETQTAACGAPGQRTPSLASKASQWSLVLRCERAAVGAGSGAASWGLLYTAGARGETTRAATIGSRSEVDAWLTRVGALVQGPRQVRLKSIS